MNPLLRLYNELTIPLLFQTPQKDYECQVMIKSRDQSDIRIFQLKFIIYPKPQYAKIEMKISAGESVTQSIPIVNDTQNNWQMKIGHELNKGNATWFTYDPGMAVAAGTTKDYSITFKPRWMDTAGMLLHMEIPDTHEKFTYEIWGFG